jgi:ABC-type glycerol-3-phosphate transport system substrate-binding protein
MPHEGSRRHGRVTRRTTLKALTAAGVAGLAGCAGSSGGGGGGGGGGGSTAGSTAQSDIEGDTVRFIKGETGDQLVNVIERATEAFEEETGATVETQYTGIGDSKYERIVSLIQAGDAPEIASINLSIGGQFLAQDAIAPVTENMRRLIDRHGEPVVRYRQDGEDYMIPFTQGTTDYWFRDDLLSDVGLDEEFVPDTWDKLMEYARLHAENGPDDLREGVFVMSGQAKATGNFMMGSFHMANGGKVTQWTGDKFEVAFASGQQRDKMIETLSYIQNLHEYSVDAGGAGESENEHAIPTGLGAATFDAGARVKLHSAHHENLPYDSATSVTNVGHIPEKETTQSQAQVGPLWVFKDAENTEAGKRFIEFLMKQPEFAADFCWADGPVHCQPPFPGLKESEPFMDHLQNDLSDHWQTRPYGGYDNSNGIGAAAKRHLEEATANADAQIFETEQPNPHLGSVWATGILSEMVQAVNIDGEDPEAVVDEFAPEVQKILDRSQEQ